MSKYVSKLSKVGISLFAVFCMIACHTGEINHNYENMVYVNQTSLDLFFGDTEQLTASPTESTFEWTSEDPSIATVTNEGLVTATGVGNTQITIAQGEWTKTIDVTVSLPTSKEVLARAGNKRVLIEVTIDNEKVQKMNVICNNNNSSIEEEVNYKSGVFKFYYDNLEENKKYDFTVTCVDRYGNQANPINVSANVYGESFQSTLSNRTVEVATRFGNGLVVKWKDKPGSCVLNYKNEAGYNYRSEKGDDNSPGVDTEFGMNIGYTGAGEWQMFTLDVQDEGTYAFDLFRSVNNGNGGYYSLEVDGVATNSVHMINDNDWNAFKWQHDVYPENQPKLYLTKGKHTVKFIIGEGGNFNYKFIRFAYQQ